MSFLPTNKQEIKEQYGENYDFLFITADAYCDHPSFGTAILSRVLAKAGFTVAVLAQPNYKSKSAFLEMGRPSLGAFISGGNMDSMVCHYTASKKKRNSDAYSPGGAAGLRPDRPTIVYSNRVREAFPGLPVIIGGLEASLRRFAHYDYWQDKVRRSILIDSGADILVFGMGERSIAEIAHALKNKTPTDKIPGTVYISDKFPEDEYILLPSFYDVSDNKRLHAQAVKTQYEEQNPYTGKVLVQPHNERQIIVQNPPAAPLSARELDAVYALPYERRAHPMYVDGIPAMGEVAFSITSNRGCFGGCSFCALSFHQGRIVTSRSKKSIIEEAKKITHMEGFKGYIHDIGGPSANFRRAACENTPCKNRLCLFPKPCKNLIVDHSEYLDILKTAAELPGVKKVFVRSGIRYDYLLADKNDSFFQELVKNHVSGQLKVAPEHSEDRVLELMGKPSIKVFDEFKQKFMALSKKFGKEQYLVPYLMSSHPGSRLIDAFNLASYLKKNKMYPEQVQDFYPTPGTISTAMFYTGIDPRTGKSVYIARDYEEKLMQRALLQWKNPKNRALVNKALRKLGKTGL